MLYLFVIVTLMYMCTTICKKLYIGYKLKNTKHEIKNRYNQLIHVLTKNYNDNIFVERLLNHKNPKFVLIKNPSTQGFGYNINKGEEIGLCMLNYKTGLPNKIDDIFYILLHELAHIMTISYTHDEEFYANFHFLCTVASENNIFVLNDYKNNPSEFGNGYIKVDDK